LAKSALAVATKSRVRSIADFFPADAELDPLIKLCIATKALSLAPRLAGITPLRLAIPTP
jgi:hypothetical protein